MPGYLRRLNNSRRSWKRSHTGALCTLIVLLPLLFGLFACDAPAADSKIHLTLWYWDGGMDDKVLAEVNQHFPNIVLDAEKISGDSNTKIRTAMAAQNGVPDIIGFRGDASTAGYFPDEDQFYDLKSLGVDDVQSQYLSWKWKLGIAPDGKMIGFPMDTGPTALFYRTDVFAKAGLPTDPQQVANKIQTWDDYLQVAQQVKNATHGKSLLLDNITTVFNEMLAQSPIQYFDKTTGRYTADQPYMKRIWDQATKAHTAHIAADIPMWTQGWTQAVSNGLISAFVGAVWMKGTLQLDAPNTKGLWHITRAPGGAGNDGGSALGITKYSQHPKEALQVIEWIQSPQNQLTAYKDLGLYPSTLAALNDPSIYQPEPFYGNQDTSPVFAASAKEVPPRYIDPKDGDGYNGFTDMLNLVEFQNLNPEQGWEKAQVEIHRQLLR